MRLRYLILFTVLFLLIGLNRAGQGITGVVGDGPWQVTSLEWKDDYLVFWFFGQELILSTEVVTWVEQFKEFLSSFYIKWF